MSRIETQPKRITSGRLIAAGVVLGTAALGSGFAGHSENHSSDTGTNNTLKVSNVDINSIHSQNPDYVSIAKQMEALSKKHKQTTLKVEITQKGESLTEATAKAFEESTDRAFARLQKVGLSENDMVFVKDTFEVPIDQNGEIAGGVVKSESLSQLRVASESTGQVSDANFEVTSADCIPTDLKGHFEFTDADKNIVGNPSRLHLENVQPPDRQYCNDNVWIRSFGSTQNPYSAGWLENQDPITSQITIHNSNGSTTLTSTAEGMVTIPNNTTDLGVDINVTETKYCWVQIEAVRTDSLDPKVYSGVNMINYALYPNPDMDPVTCQVRPTVTPTNTATPTITSTSTPEPSATNTPEADCIVSDVKGELNDLEDSNHLTGNPVTGKVSNIATNPTCSDDIYVHMYGSMEKPTGTGQNIGLNIESQKGNHILTQQIIVPENTVDMPIEVTIPQNKFCTVQVDLTRDGEIKDEPRYIDNDFLLFIDEENCNPKTATATATAIASPTATASPVITFTSTVTNTDVPRSTRTPIPTNTPVSPTSTPVPPEVPTAMPTEKPTETPPTPNVSSYPNTGFGPQSKDSLDAPWINFATGASALGLIGLGMFKRGLETWVTEGVEGKKKKKKIESKS